MSIPKPNRPEPPHPIDVEIGRRIRDVRTRQGRTQTDLANALGVTFQQVQKYERGSNRFSASRLVQAMGYLGLSPAWLFDGLGADGSDTSAVASGSTKLSLNAQMQALSPARQRLVRRLIDELGSGDARRAD